MWQRPAKCEKVNFLFFFFSSFPDLHSEITKVAHVGLFFFFLLMLPLIAKHPHLISFVFHSFWVESISCLHLIFPAIHSLYSSIWLSLVHFLPRLPAPDSVGSASAGSRQVEIRRGGVTPLMCYQWQVAVTWPEDCQYQVFFCLFV